MAKDCGFGQKTKKITEKNKKRDKTIIPAKLQYRLDLVMMDLKKHLNNKNLVNKNFYIAKEQHIISTVDSN